MGVIGRSQARSAWTVLTGPSCSIGPPSVSALGGFVLAAAVPAATEGPFVDLHRESDSGELLRLTFRLWLRYQLHRGLSPYKFANLLHVLGFDFDLSTDKFFQRRVSGDSR